MPARPISDRPASPTHSAAPATAADYVVPTAIRDWASFIAGAGWSGLAAAFISGITRTPYASVFSVCLIGSLLAGTLVWLTRGTQRDRSQPGQFTIRSLLFAICLVALYFAAVRWVGAKLTVRNGTRFDVLLSCFVATFPCGLIALISIPIASDMVESLLRTGAWSLRQPIVRSWLKGLWPLRKCGAVDAGPSEAHALD